MFGKKVKSRFIYLLFLILSAAVIIFLVIRTLEENVVYFFSPTEIYNKSNISYDKKIRVGCLVQL